MEKCGLHVHLVHLVSDHTIQFQNITLSTAIVLQPKIFLNVSLKGYNMRKNFFPFYKQQMQRLPEAPLSQSRRSMSYLSNVRGPTLRR